MAHRFNLSVKIISNIILKINLDAYISPTLTHPKISPVSIVKLLELSRYEAASAFVMKLFTSLFIVTPLRL